MGNPQHYSRELPERCLQLIEELWPAVERVFVPRQQHLGPLTTTFLLAMATPIITLPIERIDRQRDKVGGYVDDRWLDEGLTEEVRRVFSASRFDAAPFFRPGCWRFTTMPYNGENLARRLPFEAARELAGSDALDNAARMPVEQWKQCLRNALAHGGVLYLDREGYQSDGGRTEALAFVSARYPNGDMRQPPDRLNVLRISEDAFLLFLKAWVDWLRYSGLSRLLAA